MLWADIKAISDEQECHCSKYCDGCDLKNWKLWTITKKYTDMRNQTNSETSQFCYTQYQQSAQNYVQPITWEDQSELLCNSGWITCYKSSWCSMHPGRLSHVQQWKQGMTASFCINTEWSLTLQSLSLCFCSFTNSLQRKQRIKTMEAVWQTGFRVTTMKERNKIRHVFPVIWPTPLYEVLWNFWKPKCGHPKMKTVIIIFVWGTDRSWSH